MSIFSGNFDPGPWLREKTANALRSAVHLIDIANQPDTTPWYRKTLMRVAEQQLHALVPVVALIYDADEEAANYDQWRQILDGGSFALGGWCRKWKIADAPGMASNSALEVRSSDEINEKDEEPLHITSAIDFEEASETKLEIYARMTRRMVHGELPPAAQKLLLWLLSYLKMSETQDVVMISRRFLPTDIGLTVEETNNAYRLLFEQGYIDCVEQTAADAGKDRLSVRLVVEGLNDARHHRKFREETFGYPGARIAGKPTGGQTLFIQLSETRTGNLSWWFKHDRELPELRDVIQATMGDDVIHVENAGIKITDEKPTLEISFRFPLDAELKPLESQLSKIAKEWIQQKLTLGDLK